MVVVKMVSDGRSEDGSWRFYILSLKTKCRNPFSDDTRGSRVFGACLDGPLGISNDLRIAIHYQLAR